MSQSEQTSRIHAGADVGHAAKKPYRKPAVRYERVFEVQALSCGKIQTTQRQCQFNRRAS